MKLYDGKKMTELIPIQEFTFTQNSQMLVLTGCRRIG